ncbi:TPA: SDR family oxidoreductase [Pseudomonas aeruginosa]|nr:SDR family oxidoreductase [Pseudomonas aeruginosa]HCT4750270.1 SDR family oxidoreductase [Pseudomonas aeruginosa]
MHLAWTLSAELLERGIRVNALSPGPTRTPALDKAATDLEAAALREKIVDLVPPGRLGEPLEIASAALFLASNEPRCRYGTESLVDGGVRHLKKGAKARSW